MPRLLRPAEVKRRRILRRTRKVRRFDGPTPACLFCGLERIEALRAVQFEELPERLKRKVIEQHHPDGRDVSSWTIPICHNCHLVESDAQADLPRPLHAPRTKTERAAALLAADARFFRRWGEVCQERSAMLECEVAALLGLSPTHQEEDPRDA
jgi:hypothetical protein